ncbi:MAG: 23S rRNA (adenine(2503)-C(2))-methyltransferase [Omnitrophica bacterium RIFCSPLOWO2_02_FULL_45_16]|nr:MAG: 23S rRNA (adenine(2503)-C(2))-methyltransferase [Omnitrophica bacterium RIFCSPLOWO2_01_FULL_45_24]OGX00990.1 MAG: 23S rRNA (adenine(2503)-C(2))-methyltransferase [Omnitrophica bacterium RIFCSPLOWO2_02_FULL_45_16]
MEKTDIKNLSKDELEKALAKIGEEPYRAAQIFRWLYKAGVKSFDEMTDIGKELREKLKSKFRLTKLILLDSKHSLVDGTTKYLFKLEDSNTIESVFLPEDKRVTLCLSSQVGCKFGCAFCASAPFGFVRNLKASEILDEALFIKDQNPSSVTTNIVFMGIGEPLDNYDNVMKAIRVLNDEDAFKIGARKITISTCGVIPGIERLSDEKLQVELSVSLHSADDDARSKLVPVNKRYRLKDMIAACKNYVKKTKRIITFEYVLIKDVNVSDKDAADLARLLKGMTCKVNTISYNQIRAKGYEAPSNEDVKIFINVLKKRGVNVLRRKSKGEDIDAGCGQLRISKF